LSAAVKKERDKHICSFGKTDCFFTVNNILCFAAFDKEG
jgi:hypothetical protein